MPVELARVYRRALLILFSLRPRVHAYSAGDGYLLLSSTPFRSLGVRMNQPSFTLQSLFRLSLPGHQSTASLIVTGVDKDDAMSATLNIVLAIAGLR